MNVEERKVRAMPVVKLGLFVASTLVLLHRVLQRSVCNGWIGSVKKSEVGGPSVLPSLSPGGLCANSRAPTAVHHHGRDLAVDDLLFSVKVEHVDGRHLGGGAAGARSPSGVGLVHQVGVRVLLQVHVLTLPGAIVGLVALWGNNPVPAKVLEVHRERVAAAPGLWRVLVAVQARVSPHTPGALRDLHLHERLLQTTGPVCEYF